MSAAAGNFFYAQVLLRHLAFCRAHALLRAGEPCLTYDLDLFVEPVWFGYLNCYLVDHD